MRYAIFADVHSNLQAYEAVIKDSKDNDVADYLCAGDIVGYGAQPHECIKLTKDIAAKAIVGNHDCAAVAGIETGNFNQHARCAVLWTQAQIDDIEADYIRSLKFIYEEDDITLVHGSLYHPEEFDYVLDISEAGRSMRIQTTQLCFIGHTHVPEIFFASEKGPIEESSATEVIVQEGFRYLINVGSVGQPRDRDRRSCYCIYDTSLKKISIRRVEYDVGAAQDKILRAGLPSALAKRLSRGR